MPPPQGSASAPTGIGSPANDLIGNIKCAFSEKVFGGIDIYGRRHFAEGFLMGREFWLVVIYPTSRRGLRFPRALTEDRPNGGPGVQVGAGRD